jgi:hypothetical protein
VSHVAAPKVSTTMTFHGQPPGRYAPAMAYRTRATHRPGLARGPARDRPQRSVAVDPSQPRARVSALDAELRGLLVEAGVHDLSNVGAEAVAVRSLDRPGRDHPTGDLGLARPLPLGPRDRANRGGVQGEPRLRALARARHGTRNRLAVLEGRLDPGLQLTQTRHGRPGGRGRCCRGKSLASTIAARSPA